MMPGSTAPRPAWSLSVSFLSFQVCGLLLLGLIAQAGPDDARVSFQGRLANPMGVPVPDGWYDMVFRFYDAPAAGTLLLTDRHVAGGSPVTTSGGLYTVLLGGGDIVAGSETNLWQMFVNHPQVYVGVSVGSAPELTPLLRLTPVPYAVRADDALTLAGKSAAQFLDASAVSQVKTGQLVLAATAPIQPVLEVTNISGSGTGIRSTVAGAGPAVVAVNAGGGPILQGQSGSGGGVVFDVANNGTVTTSGRYTFAAARTNRLTLGPADFVPRHPSEEQYVLWGYPWKTNRHYLVCTMQSGFATFHANVHVPEGATMTKLVSYLYDVDPGRSSTLNLARCSLFGQTGPDPVYLATTTSVNNQIRVERPLAEVANTSTNHYVLTLQLFWSDLGMQFLGAQVEYTYTELKN
jgi:hypothetical protein